jgi:hypothetical protein
MESGIAGIAVFLRAALDRATKMTGLVYMEV